MRLPEQCNGHLDGKHDLTRLYTALPPSVVVPTHCFVALPCLSWALIAVMCGIAVLRQMCGLVRARRRLRVKEQQVRREYDAQLHVLASASREKLEHSRRELADSRTERGEAVAKARTARRMSIMSKHDLKIDKIKTDLQGETRAKVQENDKLQANVDLLRKQLAKKQGEDADLERSENKLRKDDAQQKAEFDKKLRVADVQIEKLNSRIQEESKKIEDARSELASEKQQRLHATEQWRSEENRRKQDLQERTKAREAEIEAERRERRLLRVLRRRRRSWPFAPARHTYMGARVSEMRRRRETDTNVGALSDGDDTRRAILDEEDSDEEQDDTAERIEDCGEAPETPPAGKSGCATSRARGWLGTSSLPGSVSTGLR